jgi:zinc D-Ala-D-Ala dipeptidase
VLKSFSLDFYNPIKALKLSVVNSKLVFFCFFLVNCQTDRSETTEYTDTSSQHAYLDANHKWVIKNTNKKDGVYLLGLADKIHLYTGRQFILKMSDSILIRSFKLFRETPPAQSDRIRFKLFLNNRYAGKYTEGQRIVISNGIFDIRLVIVHTGTEKMVHAWDTDFLYTKIQDASPTGIHGLVLGIYTDSMEVKTLKIRSVQAKTQNTEGEIHSRLEKIGLHKPVVIIAKSKHKPEVIEQLIDFGMDGYFSMYRVKANVKNKEAIEEIEFRGNFQFVKDSMGNDVVDLSGNLYSTEKLSGKRPLPQFVKTRLSSGNFEIKECSATVLVDFPDYAMVNIKSLDSSIRVDIPYASSQNVIGRPLYDCNKCFLRYIVAKKIIEIKPFINKIGLDIKMWDCYRPLAVQQILFDAFPIPGFVADPVGGSIHNRGTAVDITLTDLNGNDLDMGSGYDEFTFRSHISYKDLADTTIRLRFFLRETMLAGGFVPIRSEWWHFEYIDARKFPKTNDPFPCGKEW